MVIVLGLWRGRLTMALFIAQLAFVERRCLAAAKLACCSEACLQASQHLALVARCLPHAVQQIGVLMNRAFAAA